MTRSRSPQHRTGGRVEQHPNTPHETSPNKEDQEKVDSQSETGTHNTVRRFFRVADKMIAQGKGKETQPKRAVFAPHHERAAKKNHSAEGFPRCKDKPETGAESNEEGTRQSLGRRKIPRMFQKPAAKKQGEGAAEEDPLRPPPPHDADTHLAPWKPLTSR